MRKMKKIIIFQMKMLSQYSHMFKNLLEVDNLNYFASYTERCVVQYLAFNM